MLPLGKDIAEYGTVAVGIDLYLLEARPVGGHVWTPTAGYCDPMDSATASRIVKELNLLSERVVYRSVLVKVAA